jgi:hypothetical protein
MFTCIHHLGIVSEGMVCHLRRSLYGLKQAPQSWFQRFASVVTIAGFSTSAHDPAHFVHVPPCGSTLLLYVDDMIITGDDPLRSCRHHGFFFDFFRLRPSLAMSGAFRWHQLS